MAIRKFLRSPFAPMYASVSWSALMVGIYVRNALVLHKPALWFSAAFQGICLTLGLVGLRYLYRWRNRAQLELQRVDEAFYDFIIKEHEREEREAKNGAARS